MVKLPSLPTPTARQRRQTNLLIRLVMAAAKGTVSPRKRMGWRLLLSHQRCSLRLGFVTFRGRKAGLTMAVTWAIGKAWLERGEIFLQSQAPQV
jgi:hypothetical protein